MNLFISLAAYDNVKKIVVKFAGNANQFSGAVVLGNWAQQESFDNAACAGNTFTVDVKSAQASLVIYQWWSNTDLEIESIDLVF